MGDKHFAVFTCDKQTGNGGGLSVHIERQKWDEKEKKYVVYSPACIRDHSRTQLNKDYLLKGGAQTRTKAIEDRIRAAGVTRKIKADAVKAITIICTSDHEKMDEIEKAGRLDEWANDCIEFCRRQFGADNVVSAALHMDESTPHLHITVVPIVTGKPRERKGKEAPKEGRRRYKMKEAPARLCAKEVMTRTAMVRWQDEFAGVMAKYGMSRGIEGTSQRRVEPALHNKQMAEEAAAKATVEENQAKENVEALRVEADALADKIEDREEEAAERQFDVWDAENELDEKNNELAELTNEVAYKRIKAKILSDKIEEREDEADEKMCDYWDAQELYDDKMTELDQLDKQAEAYRYEMNIRDLPSIEGEKPSVTVNVKTDNLGKPEYLLRIKWNSVKGGWLYDSIYGHLTDEQYAEYQEGRITLEELAKKHFYVPMLAFVRGEYQNRIFEVSQKNTKYINENEHLKEENEKLSQNIDRLKSRENSLQNNVNILANTLTNKKQEAESAQARATQAKAEEKTARENIDSLTNEKEELNGKVTGLKAEVEALSKKKTGEETAARNTRIKTYSGQSLPTFEGYVISAKVCESDRGNMCVFPLVDGKFIPSSGIVLSKQELDDFNNNIATAEQLASLHSVPIINKYIVNLDKEKTKKELSDLKERNSNLPTKEDLDAREKRNKELPTTEQLDARQKRNESIPTKEELDDREKRNKELPTTEQLNARKERNENTPTDEELDARVERNNTLQTNLQKLEEAIKENKPKAEHRLNYDMQIIGYGVEILKIKKLLTAYKTILDSASSEEKELFEDKISPLLEDTVQDFCNNAENIIQIASNLFLGYIDQATTISNNCGGGGDPGTGWGRKDDDDDLRFKQRCFFTAMKMVKPAKVQQQEQTVHRGFHR